MMARWLPDIFFPRTGGWRHLGSIGPIMTQWRPDVFLGFVAFVFAAVVGAWLNGKWYHEWMDIAGAGFGDPASSPSYYLLKPLFVRAPFAAGGIVSGLIAGQGAFRADRLLIRILCGPVAFFCCCLLLDVNDPEVISTAFFPCTLVALAVSATSAAIYQRWDTLNGKSNELEWKRNDADV